MHSGEIAIEANRLSKRFGDQLVLNEIDLRVSTGEAVAIIGANGTGKTTLLRCLASMLRPTSGHVTWFGRSPFAIWSDRRLMGTLGHESCLYPHLTVRENLLFAARMCDVAEPQRRVGELLEMSGIAGQANRATGRIARGMQQRVAILRSLVHEPPILLFDEPTSGLDAVGTDWLIDVLNERRNHNCAICFATHDNRLMYELADRLVELRAGRVHEIHRKLAVSNVRKASA